MDESRKNRLEALGAELAQEFASVRSQRESLVEDRWLTDERQYRGILDPEIEGQIQPGKSRAVHRLTKVKVDTIKSRLMGLIFPPNGTKNWEIKPTPYPEIHPVLLENALRDAVTAGQIPPEAVMRPDVRDQIKHTLAADARKLMAAQMEDHLVEGSMSYREQCSKVVFQACKLGVGILKGPLPERRRVMKFTPQPDETGAVRWSRVPADELEYFPFREQVSAWSVYPDLAATDIRQCRFVWQTHLMSREEVFDLAGKAGFEADMIRDYLNRVSDGDALPWNFEQSMRQMGSREVPTEFKHRYRILERWGYLSERQLLAAGIDVPEDMRGTDIVACVWLLGDRVIKAVLQKSYTRCLPYYFFTVVEDDSTIFPEGVPHIMRNPQRIINAALRMMMDNAGMASGPIVGLNYAALDPALNPDPQNLYPRRVYLFDSVEDMREAMTVWNVDSHIPELMNLISFMSNFADETTAPRFMQGDGQVRGAGETASGLSMLMGAANVNLKDLVMFFDEQITSPFIKALYEWEMQYNPRSEIKGDFSVVATGSSSLIAKEVQSQQLLAFAQTTTDPRFAPRVNTDVLLRELAGSMEVDADRLIFSEEEFQQRQQQEQVMGIKAQIEAVLQTMAEKGMDPNQALAQMLGQSVGSLQQMQGGAA